jgi:(2Fe-2S) ferredoxin
MSTWRRLRVTSSQAVEVRPGSAPEIGFRSNSATSISSIVEASRVATSTAWEDVTRHRRQVLICRGPRCTARGSDETARALILGLMEAGLGDHDVLVTHTGCQFPCNQAPVVSVQPDDVWYGGVDPHAARRIVSDHLLADTPVESRRLPR